MKTDSLGQRWLGILLTIVGFTWLSISDASAQRKSPSEEEMKQIHDAKVSMITNRLSLTTDQSEKFWPLYNEYSVKKRELRRSQRKLFNEKRDGALNDKEAMNNLKNAQELKQKEVDLEKEYQTLFLKVITPSQLSELHGAEKSFNDMLLQRLDRKKN